jgi:uncharacterized protein (UPF0332 family)
MNERIIHWLSNKAELDKSYKDYMDRRIIQKIPVSTNLVKAHIEKSDHNLEFSYFLFTQNKFIDWIVVGLYYAVYHASLALLANKGFSSKDHTATLCFLIKHYSEFSEEDIRLYYDLLLTQEEIQFYTTLKRERQKASYTTVKAFDEEKVKELREKAIGFVNKVKTILES